MQIGRVSEQTGLSVDAIRFYEKQRLLDRPPRTEGGFRLFHAGDLQRLRFIQRAQRLGFSLPEIRELIFLQQDSRDECPHVRDLLRAKIQTVRERIRELSVLERELARGLRNCERNLRASEHCNHRACPVLREVSHGGSCEN